jgi:hypothetical protein
VALRPGRDAWRCANDEAGIAELLHQLHQLRPLSRRQAERQQAIANLVSFVQRWGAQHESPAEKVVTARAALPPRRSGSHRNVLIDVSKPRKHRIIHDSECLEASPYRASKRGNKGCQEEHQVMADDIAGQYASGHLHRNEYWHG